MKKVFMSIAVIAMMIAVAACGSNNSKKAEETPAPEVIEETVEAAADTLAAAADTLAAAAEEAAAEL